MSKAIWRTAAPIGPERSASDAGARTPRLTGKEPFERRQHPANQGVSEPVVDMAADAPETNSMAGHVARRRLPPCDCGLPAPPR